MFRSSILRLLGCTGSLITGFKRLRNLQPDKARSLVEEFLSITVSLCKFVCDKAISFLSLKKLSQDTAIVDFSHYLSQLVFWENVSDAINSLKLFDEKDDVNFGEKIIECRIKIQSTFEALRSTKRQLQEVYIGNMHKNVINVELKASLEDDTWQAVDELPPNYRTMFAHPQW
jgi:hypothetical protein